MILNNLADMYALAKAELDAAEARVADLKKQINALGVETLEGDHCTIVVDLSERTTVDSKAVRLILTDDQFKSVSKTTLVQSVRIKAKIPAVAA